MERARHVGTATLRGARIVGIACAIAFFAPIVLAVALPQAFFFAPYHPVYERMIGALLLSLGFGLLLALRDPARNAGVYAIIGLASGFLLGATVYSLLLDGGDSSHWFFQVPLLAAITLALVVTYTRLRQPHPAVVRIVVAAVVLLPIALYLYDLAYTAFIGLR